MKEPPNRFFDWDQFVPSLRAIVDPNDFDPRKLMTVPIAIRDPDQFPLEPLGKDRREIPLVQSGNILHWEVDSLRALFRGDAQPPPLGDYPEAYGVCFVLLDLHVLEYSRLIKSPRDREMKEIFSTLRRRPDGKSTGPLHDYMWQAAALVLGTQPLSQAEFEAILGRLERSCDRFEMGPTSKNYAEMLDMTFGAAA